MADVVLLPRAAVDRICHDEQMTVWVDEVAGALSIGGFLRGDLEYDEVIALHECLKWELRNIVAMALDHPEARTIVTRKNFR